MNVVVPVDSTQKVRGRAASAVAPAYVENDQERWDSLLAELGGRLHQSWRWGEFKRREGWDVERVMVETSAGTGMAQILFKRRGPVSTAFIPRGPLIRGEAHQALPALLERIERICRRHRAISVTIESEHALPLDTVITGHTLPPSTFRYTPGRTVVVPLVDDEGLVCQMHATKRKQIRRAERRGITIEHVAPTVANLAAFHSILEDTSIRYQSRLNPTGYYADFLEIFGDDAALLFAVIDGEIAAGMIAASFGGIGTDMFAGSSTRHREQGSTSYLKYHLMRWARDRGCLHYDLWGIPMIDSHLASGPDQVWGRSGGSAGTGLYRFKVEFGGEIVSYPPSIEYQLHPGLSRMVRRLKAIDRVVRH